MSYNLTPKQQELKNYIEKHAAENGCAPSYDEMAVALNFSSKSGIHWLVTALEERGHIRRIPNKARSIQVIKTNKPYLPSTDGHHAGEIPFLGKLSDINREIAKDKF